MDKIRKVSISGLVFSLEGEADSIFKTYLETLSSYYEQRAGGQEIMDGIESRLAELLIDRCGKTGTVTAAMAKEVTGIIGSPDILCEDSTGTSGKTDIKKKRLYRNPEGKTVGGVCGGLGAYFNVDPVWIRIGFVALGIIGIACSDFIDFAPLISVVIYCALWAAMPLARSTRQKCEMHGESLSYEGIERQVENGQRNEAPANSTASEILSVLGRITIAFIGFTLLIVGFSGVIALFCTVLGFSVAGLVLPDFLGEMAGTICSAPHWSVVTMKILSLMVTFIPFAALLYGGIKMIFRFNTPRWKPGLVLLVLWLCAVVALLVIGLATIPGILNSWASA